MVDISPLAAGEPRTTPRADGKTRMTDAQRDRLWQLCGAYNVAFREDDYAPTFDLPDGYVAGWVGGWKGIGDRRTLYVGVSPAGEASS
jgi:hypothetical protein